MKTVEPFEGSMNSRYVGVGVGISMGLCFGAALGAAMQNVAVGVAVGVALGSSFGLVFSGAGTNADRKKVSADKPLPHPLGLWER
jgi:hypothetical protein